MINKSSTDTPETTVSDVVVDIVVVAVVVVFVNFVVSSRLVVTDYYILFSWGQWITKRKWKSDLTDSTNNNGTNPKSENIN